MKVKCRILLEYASNEEAKRVEKSLKPDNENFISTRVNGNVLEAETDAESVLSILHTLDDFLACLSVAERIGASLMDSKYQPK